MIEDEQLTDPNGVPEEVLGEESEEALEEVPVVPLKVVPSRVDIGSAEGSMEARAIRPQYIEGLVRLDAQNKELLYKLGVIEANILKIATEKIEIYKEYLGAKEELHIQVNKAAHDAGVDPEDLSKAWTLNLASRLFIRTK